jgi:hypothetical protein
VSNRDQAKAAIISAAISGFASAANSPRCFDAADRRLGTWQRTLLLAPLMVVPIVFGIAPLLQKHFGSFLRRQPRR